MVVESPEATAIDGRGAAARWWMACMSIQRAATVLLFGLFEVYFILLAKLWEQQIEYESLHLNKQCLLSP